MKLGLIGFIALASMARAVAADEAQLLMPYGTAVVGADELAGKSGNDISIDQSGDNNRLLVDQSGTRNAIQVVQAGNGGHIAIVQSGSGNTALVYQH